MKIYIADNQDITRAGLLYIVSQRQDCESKLTSDKSSLIEALKEDSHVMIVLDYTLFDINDAAELCIISQRFPEALWILFSEDLSQDFLREIVLTCPKCGILLKDCSMAEIREALDFASKGKRYICQQITELLLATPSKEENQRKETLPNLTKTELEILKDIALGMTTKEIAQKRFRVSILSTPTGKTYSANSLSTTCMKQSSSPFEPVLSTRQNTIFKCPPGFGVMA